MASPLDSTIFIFSCSKKGKKTKKNMGFTPTILKSRAHGERGGQLMGDLLDDQLTPCAGTLRTIAFTMYKTAD